MPSSNVALGLGYWKTEQWDEAATAFLEQVRVAPNHREAWANLGWALQQQRKRREAIAASRSAKAAYRRRRMHFSFCELRPSSRRASHAPVTSTATI